jgi:predicted TIM-barrel fold metal-dependent hydrolase
VTDPRPETSSGDRIGDTGLFDSNAHPNIGSSPPSDDQAPSLDGYKDYVEAARSVGFTGGCAVALPGTDPHSHFERCRAEPFLTPVAPWTTTSSNKVGSAVRDLVDLGYRALKVHPRLGGPAVRSREFLEVVRSAADHDMVVFVCTYPFGKADQRLGDTLLNDLEVAVAAAPTTRLVLLHGGSVDLLRYMEFCRANDHLLLDVSLALMKYRGSSLDNDLWFVFSSFDRRTCIGSDYPWYQPAEIVGRPAELLAEVDDERCRNILRGNLEAYLRPS